MCPLKTLIKYNRVVGRNLTLLMKYISRSIFRPISKIRGIVVLVIDSDNKACFAPEEVSASTRDSVDR